MKNRRIGGLIASAAAGFFAASVSLAEGTKPAGTAGDTTTASNSGNAAWCATSCANKSMCKGHGNNTCKGKNSCAGHGWLKASDETGCTKAGGTWNKATQ